MNFENTRIYRLLKDLDPVTLNRFSKFIHSPYFNVNERITRLLDIIHNALKKGNAVESKEKLWNSVGFAGEYKDIKFRKLCNDLVERYERFLTIETLDKDDLLKANLLIRGLKDNNVESLIDKHIGKSSTTFDRIPDRSADYYLQKYIYEKNLQNLKSNYEKKEDIKQYINKKKFDELLKYLESFYIIEKLRYTIEVLTWTRQYKTDIEIDTDKIKSLMASFEYRIDAVNIYHLIFKMLSDEGTRDQYHELKKLAKDKIYSFPKNEQMEIFSALLSYCVRFVAKADMYFHKEYLDIHDWGIKEGYLISNGILSPVSFRNYVVIGLRINEFERVENYIKNNSQLLDSERRENALNFNLARVYWYKKDFNNVLIHLNRVNYDDIAYNINSRHYLLTSYYELDELDTLESAIDSSLAYLRRNNALGAEEKKTQISFVKSLKDLVRYQNNNEKLIELREKVKSNKTIPTRNWLLEKIDEQLG